MLEVECTLIAVGSITSRCSGKEHERAAEIEPIIAANGTNTTCHQYKSNKKESNQERFSIAFDCSTV